MVPQILSNQNTFCHLSLWHKCAPICKQAAALQQALPAKESSCNVPSLYSCFLSLSWALYLGLYQHFGNLHCLKSCCCFCCTTLDSWAEHGAQMHPGAGPTLVRLGSVNKLCVIQKAEIECKVKNAEELHALPKIL